MKDRTIDSITLQQYLEGTLDPRTTHELEKQALEDEFLADALEGYTYVIEPAEKLSLLQKRLNDRILVQEAGKKAFGISAQRLSIAAAAGLMFLLAVILFWMHGYKTTATSARRVEVNLAGSPINPAEGVKGAGTIAKTVVSPLIDLVSERVSQSEPVAGWEEYSHYIQKNVCLKPSVNKLVVSFKINSKGQPVNVKLSEGVPDEYSNELLQAIKNGPLWKNVDSEEVKVRIKFSK